MTHIKDAVVLEKGGDAVEVKVLGWLIATKERTNVCNGCGSSL